MASRIARSASPAGIIEALDAAMPGEGRAGAVTAHFFSFGGVERTARWALDAAATRPA